MSVATRLSIVALLVTLVSLAVSASSGLSRASQLAEGLVEDLLVTTSSSQAEGTEAYLAGVRSEMAGLALSPATAGAIDQFTAGYAAIGEADRETIDRVSAYYALEIVPQLESVRNTAVGLGLQLPAQSAGVRLQALYTVPISDEDGVVIVDPPVVVDAGDGSEYSAAHAELHPVYSEINRQSGFDDLLLIEPDFDTIVYSTQKRTDFGTSLDIGPLSGSSLATLIDSLRDARPGDVASVVDFSPYAPAGDRPRMFVASAVFDEGQLAGYVAAALSTAPFDVIVSAGGDWDGFGDTGESYIVGPDGTVRTTLRPFTESRAQFLAEPEEPSSFDLTSEERARMAATGTTALVQTVPGEALARVGGELETVRTTNYRGDSVFSSVDVIEVEGLEWAMFADVAVEELNDPIEAYSRNMLFAIAVFVVVVTFLAVRWSDRVIAPIRTIGSWLRSHRQDDGDVESRADVPASSPSEYLDLAGHIEALLARLQNRRADARARSAERSRLLAGFLPSTAAERFRDGDDVIDHARDATVVALALDGLGSLLEDENSDGAQSVLAEVVDGLDDLVTDFGLERVKITGAVYVAVCGVSRPVLDHAPRSVGFAIAAEDLVAEVAAEAGAALALRSGVDTGSVSVGVTRRSGLVYDAWGEAVDGANRLARAARAGSVSVSDRVRSQLPADYVVDAEASGDGAAVVTRAQEPST